MENNKDFKTKKFLLPEKSTKNFERDILNPEGVLAPYGVEHLGIDLIEKVYFDTVDRFFFSNGVIINLVKSKSSKLNKIVVRFEGEDKRIPFVSYMPTSLSKEIEKKDFFSAHFDFIVNAIKDIMPAGLSVDIASYVNTIIPVFVVIKNANKYRIINNNGLKMQFSFEHVEYINNATRNKHKLLQFEIRLESGDKEELFEKFIKRLVLQVPTIIPMKDSDLLNGLDYTSITNNTKEEANKNNKKTPKK